METKKVLIAYYSQSGQMREIIDQFISPFRHDVTYKFFFHEIKPVKEFPFPWTSRQFFDVFPESVTEVGCELQPIPNELKQSYDLIIIGLQVWYLSPSIPITAFLKSEEFKELANQTPVITLNGCRNMWFMAQRSIRGFMDAAQAKYVGHLVWFDKVNNLVSVITIMHWAFTARKDKKWGILPRPGVKDKDIEKGKVFGAALKMFWELDKLPELQDEFIKLGGVQVLPHLMSMEHKAKRIFKIWTRLSLKQGGPGTPKRDAVLVAFKYYLLFMIYFLSPIATLVFYLTYPLFYSRIKRNIAYYQSVK